MDEKRLELKLGVLVLAAVAGVLGVLWLSGGSLWGGKPEVSVDFGHTGNVVIGAPVKLGGIPVGRVERISLTPDRRDEFGQMLPVRMELSIEKAALAALRQDAAVTVATQGPLGESYLELWTGGAGRPALDTSKPIRGLDAPRLDLVANRLSAFLESASKVLEEDPHALANLVGGVASLTRTVDGVLVDNRQGLKEITTELTVAARELRSLSEHARRQLEPGGPGARLLAEAADGAQELPELTRRTKVVMGALAAVTAGLDEADGVRLKSALERYASAGERLDKLAERGDRLLARLEAGDGTLGASIKDPTLYNDLRELITDLRKHPWKMLWKP